MSEKIANKIELKYAYLDFLEFSPPKTPLFFYLKPTFPQLSPVSTDHLCTTLPQKLQASHIMRLLISLWDVGTVFFTIYPQVFRHEKSSIYYKYIEPLSYCFSISFKILIITVYGFMKWYICKCLFCKVYLLDLSYNRNAKPMTGSNELRFNLTQIRG